MKLVALGGICPPQRIGAKAQRLHFLLRRGFGGPRAYVCPWSAYTRHLSGDRQLPHELCAALKHALSPTRCYAVRSSANLEDQLAHSFAGQFRTVLDVQGYDALAKAIGEVWASAHGPDVVSYLDRHGLHLSDLHMAVILQEMVPARASGVVFSRNPLTGMDEVLVEAVQGSGERLVQDGVTPERWVWKWGAWIEQPPAAILPSRVAEEIVTGARRIARAFGRPADLEWVYDGTRVWWVQLREISGLNDLDIYSNRISAEFLPGLIKPLIWSINVPLVNSAWISLLTELIGPNDLTTDRLAKSFYYRAYFNMGPFGDIFQRFGMPREGLELMMGLELGGEERPSLRPGLRALLMLPRLLGFALSKVRYGRQVQADLDASAEQGADALRLLTTAERDTLTESQLLARIDALYPRAQRLAYHDILVALLERVYVRLLYAALRKRGIDPATLDLSGSIPEVAAIDPNVQMDIVHARFRALPAAVQEQVLSQGYVELTNFAAAAPLREALDVFLRQLGHLSDSGNDFSSVPWREDRDLALQMVLSHQPRASAAVAWERLPLSRLTRWRLGGLYRLVRSFRIWREQVSSRYTLGYGLFRELFMALGQRFARRGALASPDDVFYLTLPEVRQLVAEAGLQLSGIAAQRRREMAQARDVTPPRLIYGDEAPPLAQTSTKALHGTPTSRGRHTGSVRQVRSLADLPRVQASDVLVVPYSDVSWTPLFARAGAVVSESGGMLSHSSIVAREYGLPAVVSVTGALGLAENVVVTVDGYSGQITVHQSEEAKE